MSEEDKKEQAPESPAWSPLQLDALPTLAAADTLSWPVWRRELGWFMGRSLASFDPSPWLASREPLSWGPFANGFAMEEAPFEKTSYVWPDWATQETTAADTAAESAVNAAETDTTTDTNDTDESDNTDAVENAEKADSTDVKESKDNG